MVTGGKLLFVTTCYMERGKVFSLATSRETRIPTHGAPYATGFGRLTQALMVSGTRKAKH
jgi:hypothetical protein